MKYLEKRALLSFLVQKYKEKNKMPAESKKQQRFMGMVHAVQKGELSPKKVGPKVRKAAREIKYEDAKEFAETKHKNLPEKKGSVQMKFFEKQGFWAKYAPVTFGGKAYTMNIADVNTQKILSDRSLDEKTKFNKLKEKGLITWGIKKKEKK